MLSVCVLIQGLASCNTDWYVVMMMMMMMMMMVMDFFCWLVVIKTDTMHCEVF